jgi:uncharacterized Tic20 family protein
LADWPLINRCWCAAIDCKRYQNKKKAKGASHKTGGGVMADFTWSSVSIGILALMILIGILVLWKKLKDKKSGFPLDDERTQRLNWKAAYYAMFMGQYFIVAYLLVNIVGREFFGMPEIEAGYPMIAALLVSSVSFLVLRWHFGIKGEP